MSSAEVLTKRILILGLGVNNIGLTRWLLAHGATDITIADNNPTLRHDHPEWEGKVQWQLGSDYLNQLTSYEIIFRTPGIPYLSSAIQRAKRAGVEISSQTKLFFHLSPARIIGVTGTKGKGTTATLITEILNAQRLQNKQTKTKKRALGKIYLAGNIGRDPFEFLDQLSPDDWVVLELSSFQLQDLDRSPRIAVILRITEDHLDHHRTREEYLEAKLSISSHQTSDDQLVLFLDETGRSSVSKISPASISYFSRHKAVTRGAYVRWQRGKGARYGEVILRECGKEFQIARTYDFKLRGEHNLENVTAAVVAAHLAGASLGVIRKTIVNFQGLKHRLQYVGDVAGRSFYNDSFATNPEPTLAAIASFNEPIHLIVGGSSKAANFKNLAKMIVSSSTVASIIPLGRVEGQRIADEVAKVNGGGRVKILPPVDSMRDAVAWAFRVSGSGDVILLSPAAASFDLFPNYKDRGDQFVRSVAQLSKTL